MWNVTYFAPQYDTGLELHYVYRVRTGRHFAFWKSGLGLSRFATKSNSDFEANGSTRGHWKSTEPVRKIVRTAFEAAGVPSYGPHAFRHMLARHAAKNGGSVAELEAPLQNLGHAGVLTTLLSYG